MWFMEQYQDEPQPLRACSHPHSAPVAWLRPDPFVPSEVEGPGDPEPDKLSSEDQRRHDVADFLDAYESIAPEAERRDGWTPFLRKLFLQVIAETGKVSLACEYTRMSRSSAYALEARDRVFAAGWAAAAYFARNPMADDFYEKAADGITETITRSDGATVTRHRFDSRLSIAVLNRLDRRCDRAEERGSVHLAAVRNWDEYLRLIGGGDDKAAEALLDRADIRPVGGAQQCPTCPLPERANPISPPSPPGFDIAENVWKNDEGAWMTTFPPPPGFDGHQNRAWNGFDHYERACTAEEGGLLDAHESAAAAQELAEVTASAEAERDEFFAQMRGELHDWSEERRDAPIRT